MPKYTFAFIYSSASACAPPRRHLISKLKRNSMNACVNVKAKNKVTIFYMCRLEWCVPLDLTVTWHGTYSRHADSNSLCIYAPVGVLIAQKNLDAVSRLRGVDVDEVAQNRERPNVALRHGKRNERLYGSMQYSVFSIFESSSHKFWWNTNSMQRAVLSRVEHSCFARKLHFFFIQCVQSV